jgi:hypothetical protein
MTPEQDKVLLKVKKLIALANDSAVSEGERDNALRMAHGFLVRYNLTMTQVEMGLAERVKDCFDAPEEWAIHAAQGIAELFFCRYYFQRYRAGQGAPWTIRHYMIGQPANVTTAQLMAGFVIDSIRKESVSRKDRAYALSFCSGAATTIRTRCAELIKAGKADGENTPGTALVVADYYRTEREANSAYLRSNGTKVKTSVVLANRSKQEGYSAGVDFGKSVSLNPQVNGYADAPRLLGSR